MRNWLAVLSTFIVLAPLAPAQDAVVKVGAFVSLTGEHSVYGTELEKGLKLARDEINEQGGIQGRTLEFIIRDDASEPAGAIKAVLDLLRREKVAAVIGGTVSNLALAGAQVCQREKTVMIAPFATNPAITATGEYIFRISFDDRYQAEAMARFAARELGLKRVVILKNVSNPYSSDLARFFADSFKKLGGRVLKVLEYDQNTVQFVDLLSPLAEIPPGYGVYLPGYDMDTSRIVKTLAKMQRTPILLGADTWDSRHLLQLTGADFHRGYYTTLYDAGIRTERNQAFVRRFQKMYGQPPTPDAEAAYDAVKVLAAALARVEGPITSEKLRVALSRVSYEGPAGKIRFDAHGNSLRDVVLMRIRNGKRSLFKLYGAR